ncbi:hypothetical protein EDD17DRAFT_180907 [Pisolithus thermaeus]|nr:hypothetical protein EV401DRAFT_95503 [Pisolithus croceorrhizus]KAI6165726.1 hypothetical protein EDD17DRAFT_180907 [Pisolithus thermaeus]
MPFFQSLRSNFRDAFITSKVTENDIVIFVVGPTGSGKSWFTKELCNSNEIQVEKGQHPRTKNVHALRCNFKNDPNNIVVVDTPSFHTEVEGFNAEKITTTWIESRFTKKCRASGIVFLHSLARDPMHSDQSMARHLDTFATTFPAGFTVPLLVRVVPTQEPASTLTNQKVDQRRSQLESAMTSLKDNGKRKWNASMFTEVFRGQPDMAWEAIRLLLTDMGVSLEMGAAQTNDE